MERHYPDMGLTTWESIGQVMKYSITRFQSMRVQPLNRLRDLTSIGHEGHLLDQTKQSESRQNLMKQKNSG